MELDRNEYAALQQIAKAKGDITLRWEPTDRLPETEESVKAAGLVPLDEIATAELVGDAMGRHPDSWPPGRVGATSNQPSVTR